MWNLFQRKPKEKTVVELEGERLLAHLNSVEPGTDAYDKALAEVTKFQEFTGKKIEMFQKLTKEARGDIWAKITGGLCTGGLLGLMIWSEKKNGWMLSGANEKIGSGLLKGLSGLIFRKA